MSPNYQGYYHLAIHRTDVRLDYQEHGFCAVVKNVVQHAVSKKETKMERQSKINGREQSERTVIWILQCGL